MAEEEKPEIHSKQTDLLLQRLSALSKGSGADCLVPRDEVKAECKRKSYNRENKCFADVKQLFVSLFLQSFLYYSSAFLHYAKGFSCYLLRTHDM